MKVWKVFISFFVFGPGFSLAMGWESNFTTGTMSFVVTAKKSSLAVAACWSVIDCSMIFILRIFAVFITYFLVMDGRMFAVSGAVCSVLSKTAKNDEAAPSVMRPFSSTKIASSHFFSAASIRASTFGRRFRDFMSHRFHRRSGHVQTAIPLFLTAESSGSSVIVRKKFGFRDSVAA